MVPTCIPAVPLRGAASFRERGLRSDLLHHALDTLDDSVSLRDCDIEDGHGDARLGRSAEVGL